MPRGNTSADISILPPGYTDDVGLSLLINEDGSAAFTKRTRSILPSAAPPGAPSSESFDPEVRIEYVVKSAHNGVGFDRFDERASQAGLVKNVNTLYKDQLFSGPKVRYISDINYLDNGDMEAFSGAGLPTGWTNVSGATISEENTIVAEGTSSVKIVSAGAGDLCRYTLVHGEFLQCQLRLTGKVYVPAGDDPAIARINNSLGDVDYTTTTTNAWESIDIELAVAVTALSLLTIDLIPTNGDTAYFDDMKLEIKYLVGPSGPFAELEISAVDTLFHFSGRTTWMLDTADTDDDGLPRWIAKELASHVITDCVTMNDRMWRLEGVSGLWTHSTDGASWTDNTLSGGDRYGNRMAVTQTIFGYDALWKTTKPNSLGVSTTPSTGGWAYYTIGNSDTSILDLVVEDNILYIVKEDGVFIIDRNGMPQNITSSWANMRHSSRSAGGHGWLGDAYIPAGAHSLWRLNPRSRRPVHPGETAQAYHEYNGPVSMAIGDDSWMYAFVQKRDSASPTIMNIMAGRPVNDLNWRWGQVAEIDAGIVTHGWITGTQIAGTKLFWSGQAQETGSTSIGITKSPGTSANVDNSSAREWSNPSNVEAGDDVYATWPDESVLSSGPDSPSTLISRDYSEAEPFDNPSNAAASNDSRATSDLDQATTAYTVGSSVNNPSDWQSESSVYADDASGGLGYAGAYQLAQNTTTSAFKIGTFGFSLPAAAIVHEIVLRVNGRSGAAVEGHFLYGLVVDDTVYDVGVVTGSTAFAADQTWTTTKTPSDWGYDSTPLTGAKVNETDFGIWVKAHSSHTNDFGNWLVDAVWIAVTYTLPDTDGLRVTNFGITLPTDADIKGIEVSVERSVDTGTAMVDKLVRLIVAGSLSGNDKAAGSTSWPTTEAAATYGGSTDLWGLTPTRAQIVASNFGVEVRATKGTTTDEIVARIDHITITIHYDSNETSDFINLSNFGFAIPTGATIDGIVVNVERKSTSGTIKDATLQLLNASGTPAGDNKAKTLTAWPTSDASESYGSSVDTWALSPTVAMLNDSDFGVRISITGDVKDDVASIDHVTIAAFYTPAAGSELNNKMGYISVPNAENPRYDPEYEYESDGTFRTGRIARFPGWKTNWQEVTVKTSPSASEKLGSNGRQVKIKYDIQDGNGFVTLGGTVALSTFDTSPAETKYFKTGTVASVVSEDIEIEVELEHTENSETPVITEVAVVGTVRPRIVDVIEFSVLLGDDVGHETTRGEEKRAALRAMLDPDLWASTLYDRDGNALVVIPQVNGYVEVDALHHPDPVTGDGIITRAVTMTVFVVPNSASWSS